jgi:S-adenosylmethionine:tRNA ribosyltransferase-isomerase
MGSFVKQIATDLRTADFHYDLPPGLVASVPAETRDASRLLVLRREGQQSTQSTEHTRFRELGRHLPPRALLVINDTRVIAARLRAHKPTGGAVEIFLTRGISTEPTPTGFSEVWEVLARGLGPAGVGLRLAVEAASAPVPGAAAPEVTVSVLERRDEGRFVVRLDGRGASSLLAILDQLGEVPLPPYIVAARRSEGAATRGSQGAGAVAVDDRARYQTVYADAPGAVAAPTAGLHFTPALLDELRAAGHEVARVTLHVGPGTFRPVTAVDPRQHRMDEERFTISPEAARAVAEARAAGRAVVAVGTTVVRTLEASARAHGGVVTAGEGATDLFILPGDTFQIVTGLITNFHLPESTLLMLVCAFAGQVRVLAAYREAVARGYRFYSYGDAMLIVGGEA